MSVVDNERPPYVSFEVRPVEDRAASEKAGHYVSRDVDFVSITRPGSRDSLDKEALVWLAECREKARLKQMPQEWYVAFKGAYDAWKEGEELPEQGTPIKGWPVLSPGAQRTLIAAGIRTVEDLAELPDSEFSAVGTGAMGYKQKAKAWLVAAEGTGKAAAQIEALTVQVAELVALTKSQAAALAELQKKQPASAPI